MRKKERGFTLIEFLVAMAISSILTYAGTMTVSRIVSGMRQSNSQMVALRQVQNVGFWLGRDLAMSQNVFSGDDVETPNLEFVTVMWTDWESSLNNYVYYYYEDMAGGLKRIKRQKLVKDSSSQVLSSATQTLAEGVVSPVTLAQTGRTWNITVQSRSGRQTEQRNYQVLPRPNA
ncbi:MAG: prepilin-type N-terminal cleavage/methylation domain-containing protein [Chloroflexi bacterium]|nr:prepilin-type N-terminal cleavage/methylation domain-containing protein [Chloroflexota bacterium]